MQCALLILCFALRNSRANFGQLYALLSAAREVASFLLNAQVSVYGHHRRGQRIWNNRIVGDAIQDIVGFSEFVYDQR